MTWTADELIHLLAVFLDLLVLSSCILVGGWLLVRRFVR